MHKRTDLITDAQINEVDNLINGGSLSAKAKEWVKRGRDLHRWQKRGKDFENVVEDLLFPEGTGFGNQISLDVEVTTLTGTVKTVKVVADFLERLGGGKFKIIDAKYSDSAKNWATDWLSSCTDNQKLVYPALSEGRATKVTVKVIEPEKIDELKALGLNPNSQINVNNIELEILPSKPGILEIDFDKIVKLK